MSAWIVLVTIANVAALFLYGHSGCRRAAEARHCCPRDQRQRRLRTRVPCTDEHAGVAAAAGIMDVPYWDQRAVAAVGVVWIVGRAMYMHGYIQAADQRSMGFLIQAIAVLVLLIGGIVGAVMSLIAGGA